MQKQRQQIRHRTAADAREQVPEQADAERMDLEEIERKDGLGHARGVQPVGHETPEAQHEQHQHDGVLKAEIGEAIE